MDTVTILRDLWRRRWIVVCVAILAAFAGTAVLYRMSFPPKLESRKYSVGVATVRILVDTPRSQVVEIAPKGSDSLGVRAGLLASLMVDGVVKSEIAQRAGLKPAKLIGVADAAETPAAVETKPSPRDYVLSTRVVTNTGGDDLPIIEVEAQAPDVQGAARLATASVEGLRSYLDSKATDQGVIEAERLRVTGLGAPQAATVVRGPSTVIAVVAALFVFALGCGAIILVVALTRELRAAAARDAAGEPSGDSGRQHVTQAEPAEDARARDSRPAVPPRPTAVTPSSGTVTPAPEAPKPQKQSWFADPPRPSLIVSHPSRPHRNADDEPPAAAAKSA